MMMVNSNEDRFKHEMTLRNAHLYVVSLHYSLNVKGKGVDNVCELIVVQRKRVLHT